MKSKILGSCAVAKFSGDNDMKTRWLANAAILLVTIVTCLFVSEMVVRFLYKDKIVLFPRYHTDAVYGEYRIRRLRPNAEFWHTSIDGRWRFVTNAQGFRDYRNYSYEKPSGTLRIISLGDSHTEGFEVRQEKTFSSVIERYLTAHQIKAEVFNMGISGFSTAEELVYLENEGVKYKPDFVILGFFANDLDDNIKADIFRLQNGELVLNTKTYIPGVKVLNAINRIAPLRWLSENSYLYSFSFNGVWEFAKQSLLSAKKNEMETEYAIKKGDLNEYQIALTSKLIRRMYDFCQRNGIKLIVLDIPQLADGGLDFRSSVPPSLTQQMETDSYFYVKSTTVLADYSNVTEIFVPHGHRHISETTHLLLGMDIAKKIYARSSYKQQAQHLLR